MYLEINGKMIPINQKYPHCSAVIEVKNDPNPLTDKEKRALLSWIDEHYCSEKSINHS